MNTGAMQVLWLHGDMLGSASLLTNASGGVVSQARYKPWGDTRSEWSVYLTDRKYTGQREESTLGGIYDFKARYYDPVVGRFLSPDAIVPNTSNPQSLNRFSYTLNNPLRYIDPTGHYACDDEADCRHVAPSLRARGSSNDVTSWLGRTLGTVAHGQDMAGMTAATSGVASPEESIAVTMYVVLKWKAHVQDRAVWDFKHKMFDKFGHTMVLCGSGRCYGLDYSTAGNITYGFWGTQLGYSREVLGLGAGWAEVHDPAHTDESQSLGRYGVGYYNSAWRNSYYDDPQDEAAIQLGVDLYNTYGPNITEAQFTHFATKNLTKYHLAFESIPTTLRTSSDWPYIEDYFNGGQP